MKPIPAALLLLTLLSGCDGTRPTLEPTRTIEERIAALRLDQAPLDDADNPILSLKEPLETFLKETRDDFKTKADLPVFLDFEVGSETRKHCWALQQTLRDTIDRGPGRIPEITTNPDGFNVYFITQARRANGALAAKSLADGNPAGAAFHLAFTFEVADYVCACDPTVIPYIFAVHLKKQTFDDLLALYKAAPSPELLAQISTICQNSRFKTGLLESVLKTELRLGIEIHPRFPDWIREQHEEFDSLWSLFYKAPLSDCSIEELLAMNHNPEASLHTQITEVEGSLIWIASGAPLNELPDRLVKPPPPKPLDYYQSAPNGLTEIFNDCSPPGPHLNALVTHQILDAQIETALAWLRAEVDGIAVTSLDVLVPKYLDHVPADPCDGKPLRCNPEKRLIYSIGTDLQDNNGHSGFDPDATETDGIDRVLKLPASTP